MMRLDTDMPTLKISLCEYHYGKHNITMAATLTIMLCQMYTQSQFLSFERRSSLICLLTPKPIWISI